MAKRKRESKGRYHFLAKPVNIVPATKTVYMSGNDPEIETVRAQVYGAYDAPPSTPALAKNLDLSKMKHIRDRPALAMRGQYWRLVKISDNGDRGLSVVVESAPAKTQ